MSEGEGIDQVCELDLDSVVVGVEDMVLEQQNEDVSTWSMFGIDGVTIDVSVPDQIHATPMTEPVDDLFDDDEELDDTYTADGVVPQFLTTGEDLDVDFFV